MAIILPAPAEINGAQLTAEIAAAGFTGVVVGVTGADVDIEVAGLTPAVYTATEVEEALAALQARKQAEADTANATVIATIAPIVAAHVPTPPPEVTPADKLAAIGLTAEDLKVLLG